MQRVGVGSGILNFVYQHDEGDYYSVEANMSFDVSNKIGLLFQADSEGSGVKVGGSATYLNKLTIYRSLVIKFQVIIILSKKN